jgi:hypothetical protein
VVAAIAGVEVGGVGASGAVMLELSAVTNPRCHHRKTRSDCRRGDGFTTRDCREEIRLSSDGLMCCTISNNPSLVRVNRPAWSEYPSKAAGQGAVHPLSVRSAWCVSASNEGARLVAATRSVSDGWC